MDSIIGEVTNAVIPILQGQLEDLKKELEEEREKNRQLQRVVDSLNIAEDIHGLWFKARSILQGIRETGEEERFVNGLIKPSDLMWLWLEFHHISQGVIAGRPASPQIVYHFESHALDCMRRIQERGWIPIDDAHAALEQLIYPFLSIGVGNETLTWKELREKLSNEPLYGRRRP